VQWRESGSLYPVDIKVEAWDRVGLMRDITTVVAEDKVNIAQVNTVNHDDLTISLYFTLETRGLAQLSRLLLRIEGVRGVASVTRVGGEATKDTSPAQSGLHDRT